MTRMIHANTNIRSPQVPRSRAPFWRQRRSRLARQALCPLQGPQVREGPWSPCQPWLQELNGCGVAQGGGGGNCALAWLVAQRVAASSADYTTTYYTTMSTTAPKPVTLSSADILACVVVVLARCLVYVQRCLFALDAFSRETAAQRRPRDFALGVG